MTGYSITGEEGGSGVEPLLLPDSKATFTIRAGPDEM